MDNLGRTANFFHVPEELTPEAILEVTLGCIDRVLLFEAKNQRRQKERPREMTELEAQVVQRAKDVVLVPLCEESKKQPLAGSSRRVGSKRQLLELSGSKKESGVELQKISQELDPAQHSEQEGVQKHNAVDSVAMNEIQQLKVQPEVKKRRSRISELESQVLKKGKDQLSLSKSWKNQAHQNAEESKKQLLAGSWKHEGSIQQLLELSGSKEEIGAELRKISLESDPAQHSEQEGVQKQNAVDSVALASAINEIHQLKVQLEVVSESEAAKTKQLELANAELERLKGNLAETVSLVENMKSQLQECKESEAQVHAQAMEILLQLEIAKKTVEVLRSENEGLNLKLEKNLSCQREYELEKELKKLKLNEYVADLKANLMDKEAELRNISEENEMLKSDIRKREMDRGKVTKEVVAG